MTKYVLDYDKIVKGNFEEGRIKRYAKDYFCGDELASVLYLWAFNNFITNTDEVKYDCGRPMYRNLANKLTTILKPEREVSLEQAANMELRDQLDAKEQMIKTREKVIDEQQQIIQDLTHKFIRAKWWLKEIVENHRFTPISTAEMALKELTESKNDTKNILCKRKKG